MKIILYVFLSFILITSCDLSNYQRSTRTSNDYPIGRSQTVTSGPTSSKSYQKAPSGTYKIKAISKKSQEEIFAELKRILVLWKFVINENDAANRITTDAKTEGNREMKISAFVSGNSVMLSGEQGSKFGGSVNWEPIVADGSGPADNMWFEKLQVLVDVLGDKKIVYYVR